MKALLLALALGAAAGCTDSTDLLPTDGGTDACVAPGPPIQLGGGAACAGALSARLLRRAICSCSSLVLDRGLFTEGSSMGPGGPGPGGPPGAAVGTDGNLQAGGPVQVSGSLEAGGAAGAAFARTSVVFGTLRSAGAIGSNMLLTVAGDAFANGDVLGKIDINGALHVPDNANLTPGVSAADVIRGPVDVPPPCNCAAGPALDVAQLVSTHALANDDARIGLAPDAYAAGAGPSVLDLPCGSYFLKTLTVNANLDLHVHGRVGLFVSGDVTLANGLRVMLDPGAELDLVVDGNLSVQAGALGGMPPASVRVWLNGKGAHLGATASLGAAVYAPLTTFSSDGDLTASGALFGKSFQPVGDLDVRYDHGILSAGASCGAAPQPPVD